MDDYDGNEEDALD